MNCLQLSFCLSFPWTFSQNSMVSDYRYLLRLDPTARVANLLRHKLLCPAIENSRSLHICYKGSSLKAWIQHLVGEHLLTIVLRIKVLLNNSLICPVTYHSAFHLFYHFYVSYLFFNIYILLVWQLFYFVRVIYVKYINVPLIESIKIYILLEFLN